MKHLYCFSFLLALGAASPSVCEAQAQETIPFVYEVENTGVAQPAPLFPLFEQLPVVTTLPNPFEWSDGQGTIAGFADWKARRAQIASEIQHYEIGVKPTVKAGQVKAHMDENVLVVEVTVNGQTLTLKSAITYPEKGQAPYPVVIGTSMNSLPASLFLENGVAMMNFSEKQVNNYSQFGHWDGRGKYPFDRLYPDLTENGAYSEWAWGVSRLIDGLQQLGAEGCRIDTRHMAVTGCSYAGKMALFAGAFDERVALTIAQEPGGGGAAAWRVSETLGKVETLRRTDNHWFKESMWQFAGDSVNRLPFDHHELCALCCPRALLILGNPDYQWLADEAGYVSAVAAREVWKAFGIEDRMGYSIVGGHGHCQLPQSQYAHVEAYIRRFLLGQSVDTKLTHAPMFADTDLVRWLRPWGPKETAEVQE